jgi:predicted metal-binding membrane protein
MAMLVVLGLMSAGWMAAIAVLVAAQKLLPPKGRLRGAARAGDRRIRGCDHRGPLVGAPG